MICLIAGIAIVGLWVDVPVWWIYVVLTGTVLVSLIASFSMSWGFYIKAFTSNDELTEKKVAITFDDGPNPYFTETILEILERHNAKATFFCIGKHLETYPEILEKIDRAGHAIGNHSYSHSPFIGFFGKSALRKELSRTDRLIETITQKKTYLYRPPYGVTNPNLAKALKESLHAVIGWNIRPFDTTTKNAHRILNHIVKRIRPGAVILLHDTHERTPYVLEHLLLYLQEHNYKAVTIPALLKTTTHA